MERLPLPLLLINGLIPYQALADEVEIVVVVAQRQGLPWQFDVTLRHPDSGWDHYADRWRILDPKGSVLGERILYHPHEHEQPFTGSLNGVILPDAIRQVDIEAHDRVHGWATARFSITLGND